MIIYIDRLTFKACLSALHIARSEKRRPGGKTQLNVLDPIPSRFKSTLLKAGMSRLGFRVEEASFFAGHLKSSDGQSVYTAAVSSGNRIALTAAEKTLARFPFLSELNQRWGGRAVELHLAKAFWQVSFNLALRLLVADALSRQEANADAHHVAEIPPAIDAEWVDGLVGSGTKIHFDTRRSFRDSRLYGLIRCLAQVGKALRWRLKARPGAGSQSRRDVPALLLMQEDELSLDRSFRTQPHWYFKEDGKLPFDILILQSDLYRHSEIDRKGLEAEGILPVPSEAFYRTGISTRHPLRKRLRKEFRSLILKSVVGGSPVRACAEAAYLFLYADFLAAFCLKERVSVFMTCENYLPQADAMRMIATELEIHTASYQYSNMGEVGPLMMTAADTMFSFSPLYHERWIRNGIRPAAFVDTGYLFDRSFAIIRERARSCRDQLRRAGAEFIIGYLDESVQDDKYGLIHRSDHLDEIRELINLVLRESSTGLVVKTQFQRNSPRNQKQAGDTFSRADESGRYIELSNGGIRNKVFPAEAALCSDIIIGHAIGATAALEAALAGARCILLNPYGFKGANDSIYREADILYPSLESALDAIRQYRSGNPERARLGDWSSIIGRFDAFQDGRSAVRLRRNLENLFSRLAPPPTG